jgi:hypothetical protein
MLALAAEQGQAMGCGASFSMARLMTGPPRAPKPGQLRQAREAAHADRRALAPQHPEQAAGQVWRRPAGGITGREQAGARKAGTRRHAGVTFEHRDLGALPHQLVGERDACYARSYDGNPQVRLPGGAARRRAGQAGCKASRAASRDKLAPVCSGVDEIAALRGKCVLDCAKDSVTFDLIWVIRNI